MNRKSVSNQLRAVHARDAASLSRGHKPVTANPAELSLSNLVVPRPQLSNSCNCPRTEAGLRPAVRQRPRLVRNRPWPFLVPWPPRALSRHLAARAVTLEADTPRWPSDGGSGWGADGPLSGWAALRVGHSVQERADRLLAGISAQRVASPISIVQQTALLLARHAPTTKVRWRRSVRTS